jgi:hypothetical protein
MVQVSSPVTSEAGARCHSKITAESEKGKYGYFSFSYIGLHLLVHSAPTMYTVGLKVIFSHFQIKLFTNLLSSASFKLALVKIPISSSFFFKVFKHVKNL